MISDDQTMMIFDDLWITMIYDLVMIFEYLWSMMTKLWSTKLCADHSHGSFKMERLELAVPTPLMPKQK